MAVRDVSWLAFEARGWLSSVPLRLARDGLRPSALERFEKLHFCLMLRLPGRVSTGLVFEGVPAAPGMLDAGIGGDMADVGGTLVWRGDIVVTEAAEGVVFSAGAGLETLERSPLDGKDPTREDSQALGRGGTGGMTRLGRLPCCCWPDWDVLAASSSSPDAGQLPASDALAAGSDELKWEEASLARLFLDDVERREAAMGGVAGVGSLDTDSREARETADARLLLFPPPADGEDMAAALMGSGGSADLRARGLEKDAAVGLSRLILGEMPPNCSSMRGFDRLLELRRALTSSDRCCRSARPTGRSNDRAWCWLCLAEGEEGRLLVPGVRRPALPGLE